MPEDADITPYQCTLRAGWQALERGTRHDLLEGNREPGHFPGSDHREERPSSLLLALKPHCARPHPRGTVRDLRDATPLWRGTRGSSTRFRKTTAQSRGEEDP